MTYDPNSPQGPPSPASQVAQVRTNFSTFESVFARNHTALNSARQGDHEGIVLEKRLVDPEVVENLVALYCKDATSNLNTQPQIFCRIPKFLPTSLDTTDADNDPMQLTYDKVNVAGPVYQSFVAGAYLIYFGTVTSIVAPIVLSPAPTKILIAIANPNTFTNTGTFVPFQVSTKILTTSTFKINSTLNVGGTPIAYSFTWFAIAQA